MASDAGAAVGCAAVRVRLNGHAPATCDTVIHARRNVVERCINALSSGAGWRRTMRSAVNYRAMIALAVIVIWRDARRTTHHAAPWPIERGSRMLHFVQ